MYLIDSHCHLDFTIFDQTREQILDHCQQLGIQDIVIPGVKESSWRNLLDVCQQLATLHPALGLHPLFMQEHKSEHLVCLEDLISKHPVIAIGEIGLDFYITEHDKEAQIALFTEQLKIAQQTHLPVLLHVRKAHDQTISLLKNYPVSGGIVHAFNGSFQQAEHYQKLGFLLGVGGAITHPKATRLRAMFRQHPLSNIALETDAPDMPLYSMSQPYNSPENIPVILDVLATLRSESKDEIASITTTNCRRVLKLINN